MAQGSSADSLRIRYGLLAQQEPDDPLTQFAWAYAAVNTVTPETTTGHLYSDLLGLPKALGHVPSPRTYNFARVRFLSQPAAIDMQAIGERLLARDPGDDNVKVDLVSIYEGVLLRHDSIKTVPPGVKTRAISYCEKLIQAHPREPRYVDKLGLVYFYSWVRRRDVEEGQKAVDALEKYLALSPSSSQFRTVAQQYIKQVQSKENQQDHTHPFQSVQPC